jgi:hypothetical protein
MPSTRFSRRQLLAAAGSLGATLLSGCAGLSLPDGSDTERKLVLTLHPEDGPLREEYVYTLNETPSPVDDEAFAAAVAGETYTTQHRTPFGARHGRPEYARHDGTYYRLDSVVVGEETETRHLLRIYEVGEVDDLDTVPEHVSKSELPEADRVAVQAAWFAARARDNVGGVPWGLVERDGYVYRSERAVEESALLRDSGPTHVEIRDGIYRIEVSRETFHEAVYRADVDPVADTDAQMEALLRARVVDSRVDPSALSSDEAEILDAAIRDGYAESHPFSDAYESLLKRMDQWPYLDGDVEKDGRVPEGDVPGLVLLYGDRYYQYRLEFEERTA